MGVTPEPMMADMPEGGSRGSQTQSRERMLRNLRRAEPRSLGWCGGQRGSGHPTAGPRAPLRQLTSHPRTGKLCFRHKDRKMDVPSCRMECKHTARHTENITSVNSLLN